MELADILRSLRRRWRIAVAILLLTGVVVVGALATQKDSKPAPRFRAETRILVPTRDDKGAFPDGAPPELFFGQAQLAGSVAVLNAARAAVPAEQRTGVGFGYEVNDTGDIITLSATAGSADVARAVSNAWADGYMKARGAAVARGSAQSQAGARRSLQVLKERLHNIEVSLALIDPNLLNINAGTSADPGTNSNSNGAVVAPTVPSNLPVDAALLVYERADVRQRIEETGRQYAQGATTALAPGNFATIVEQPGVDNITPPASPSKTPTLLIIVVGLLLAVAVPVLVDRLDHTIRDTKTATAALAAPLLSSIPAAPRGRREEVAKPGTHREAAYRALAATSLATDRLPRSIVVTSPLGDAQDSVAANFAAALAGLGVRVALIGTLPRQGWFTHDAVLEPRNSNGSSETTTFPQLLELAYSGRLNGDAPSLLQRTTVENLFLLPPGDTTIDIANDGLPPLLEALARAQIDVTVIAAPAILNDPNTTIYAWTTRSVLWVVERGEITVEQARDAASRLSLAGAVPFGVAMVDEDS